MALFMIRAVELVPAQGQHRCWTPIPHPPPLKTPSPGGKGAPWEQPADSLWNQEWGSVPTQQWLTLPSWPQGGAASAGGCWRPSWAREDAGDGRDEAPQWKSTAGDNNEPRGCNAGKPADVPDDQLPSIGSRGHAEGSCKRCAFFSKGRCQNGKDCTHCHYNHEERKRYRKRGMRAHDSREEAEYEGEYAPAAEKDVRPEEEEEQLVQGSLCSPCAGDEADTSAPSEVEDGAPASLADTEPTHSVSSRDPETPGRRSSGASDCDPGTPLREPCELPACPGPPFEGTPARRKARSRSRTASSPSVSSERPSPASSPPVSPLSDVEFDATAEEVMRAARSLLNKLTDRNFEALCAQILALPLRTPAQLSALVAEVFLAATSQRAFLPLYAEVCQRVDAQLAADASGATGGRTFRKALVSECQASFEKHLLKARPDAEQLEGLGYEGRYAEEAALKAARLGNMRFIGELLVRRLIASRVLLAIMSELLAGSEDDLESLLALLSVAGPHFDRKTKSEEATLQSASVHATFEGLERRSAEQALSQRVRFQVRDLLEARERGWAKKSPA